MRLHGLWLMVPATFWMAGCQGTMRNIPGYTKLEEPSGLIEVRVLSKGVE